MAIFYRISAHSVYYMYLLVLLISHFGFEDRNLVLVVPIPCQCLLFTFPEDLQILLGNTGG